MDFSDSAPPPGVPTATFLEGGRTMPGGDSPEDGLTFLPDGPPPGSGGGGAGAGAAAPPPEGAAGHSTRRFVVELVAIAAAALAVALLLHTFVFQTFYIPSGSMEPTLQIGDRIVVDKLSYHLHGVGRGNIIVFKTPADEDCGGAPVNDLVKRVIGLPGEVISLSDGYVYINGKKLSEPWLDPGDQGITGHGPHPEPYALYHPYRIPPNDYFVMGDNRDWSCDSRYWGPVPRSSIVGRVILLVWPLRSFRIF